MTDASLLDHSGLCGLAASREGFGQRLLHVPHSLLAKIQTTHACLKGLEMQHSVGDFVQRFLFGGGGLHTSSLLDVPRAVKRIPKGF